MMEGAALEDYVKQRVSCILGDRVASVKVLTRDHGFCIGVGIYAPSGRRHAVGADTQAVEANPDAWVAAACATFSAWLDAQA